MNPMKWVNDWPVIGDDRNNTGCGEPVKAWKKPNVGRTFPVQAPPEEDDFGRTTLGLQWQWHANPQITWGFPTGNLGFYRLNCIPEPDGFINLWSIPNLLMQKFPAPAFTATTRLTFNARFDGEEIGFLVMGIDYQYIALKRENGQLRVRVARALVAEKGTAEEELYSSPFPGNTVHFRIEVREGGLCSFSYSADGNTFTPAGNEFAAKPGKWIGAKIGYFALREGTVNDAGTVDIDWITIR